VLRPWRETAGDAEALATAWRAAGSQTTTTDVAARWIAGEAGRRAGDRALDLVVAASGDEDAVLGEVGLRNFDPVRGRAEIGWWIVPDRRGEGLATAAVRLMADWALGPPCDLVQVWARIDPANRASSLVASRAGFTCLGLASGTEVWALAATLRS
jgi:RimJ/RimL family protein N-acetyltransferase